MVFNSLCSCSCFFWFIIYRAALQFHTLSHHSSHVQNLLCSLSSFIDSPILTNSVLSILLPLVSVRLLLVFWLVFRNSCYGSHHSHRLLYQVFNLFPWVLGSSTPLSSALYGEYGFSWIDPSESHIHCVLIEQLCRVYESSQVDKDEIIAIASHMTRLYLKPTTDVSFLQNLLQLLLLLIDAASISPSSLFDPILSLIEIPELTSFCIEFLLSCSSIHRVVFGYASYL